MLSISINSAGSTDASEALLRSLQRHQKNVSNLSSGSQISQISDDSAGFAVSFTLNNTSLRTKNIASNISNGLSYLEHQAAGLRKISELVGRMSELTTSMMDPAKADADNNATLQEMNALRDELVTTLQGKFNELNLFYSPLNQGSVDSIAVDISADSQRQITLSQSVFGEVFDGSGNSVGSPSWSVLLGTLNTSQPFTGEPGLTETPGELTGDLWGISGFTGLLEEVSRMIVDNASQQSQLRNAIDKLTTSDHHMGDAHSRIYDVDVAREVSHMARNQLLIDASASAMAQSNVTSAAVLKIITG
jgi:flagellin